MKQTLTLTHTVVADSADFTSFADLSDISMRAVVFDMLQQSNKMASKIDELKSELKALKSSHRPLETTRTTPANELTKDDVDTSTEEENVPAKRPVKRSAEIVPKVAKAPATKVTKVNGGGAGTPAEVAVAKVKKAIGKCKEFESATLGKKIGKSSKYHFINVQMRNGKLYGFRASTSIAGKTISMGTHRDEIQCALLADAHLDGIGDEKRPRNRDDFPEMMEAFKAKARENDE